MLAAALDHARPVSLSAEGDLVIRLEEANEVFQRKIEQGREQILAAVGVSPLPQLAARKARLAAKAAIAVTDHVAAAAE